MFKSNNQLEIERITLASLLQCSDIFPEIDRFVKEELYQSRLNRTVFSIIKQLLLDKKPADPILIAEKITNLNLSFGVDIYDYLESLKLVSINKSGAVHYFKSLCLLGVKRKIYEATTDVQKYLNSPESSNHDIDKILGNSDSIYSGTTKNFSLSIQNEPQDLCRGTKEYIEGLGELDGSEEIKFPYPKFHSFYGGLENGTLTLFVAGYKVGKSSFLLSLLKSLCTENDNIEGLYIDTEQTTNEVKRRLVSMLANVNEYHLRHGWRKNETLVKKVRAVWPIIENWFGKIQHLYVGNITQEETESIMRRWVWAKRANNPNVKPVLVYDYFKLSDGDSVREAFASSLVLGYKVDRIKKISSELDIPIIAAAQTNAEGNVGLSREIPKFVDSAFKLKKRTAEEIQDEGGLATHKIETICNRSLGPNAKPFDDTIKCKDREGKILYKENAILYRFDSFKVTELNTLKEQMSLQLLPQRSQKQEPTGDLF